MYLNLAELPPATARLVNIPDGLAGVRRTLKIMAGFVRTGKLHLNVRSAAIQILEQAHVLQKDDMSIVRVLHEFVRDRVRYVNDIRGVETLQTPERTLAQSATPLRAGAKATPFRRPFKLDGRRLWLRSITCARSI